MCDMKTITKFLAAMAVVAAPLALAGCDDDWDDWDDYYYDPYYWNDYYDNWSWNNNYNDEYGSTNDRLLLEAQTLCGDWQGNMQYTYLDDQSKQRVTETYFTDMEFYQYGSNANSLSGNGTETDYALDEKGNIAYDSNGSPISQTLKFTWYVDENSVVTKDGQESANIYIRYNNTGSVFVLDAGASTDGHGFFLGYDTKEKKDLFNGYMIGTNTSDVILFDFERVNTSNAKAQGTGQMLLKPKASFGFANRLTVKSAATGKLIRR